MAIFGKTLDITIGGDGVVRFRAPGQNAWVKYRAFQDVDDDGKIAFMLDNIVSLDNLFFPSGEPVTVEALRAKLEGGDFPMLNYFELLQKYDRALAAAIHEIAKGNSEKNESTPGSQNASGQDSSSPDSTAATVASST